MEEFYCHLRPEEEASVKISLIFFQFDGNGMVCVLINL